MIADFCPHCSTCLWGGNIPEDMHKHYAPPYRWRRDTGIYDRDQDRVIAWECPDCHKQWSAISTVALASKERETP